MKYQKGKPVALDATFRSQWYDAARDGSFCGETNITALNMGRMSFSETARACCRKHGCDRRTVASRKGGIGRIRQRDCRFFSACQFDLLCLSSAVLLAKALATDNQIGPVLSLCIVVEKETSNR